MRDSPVDTPAIDEDHDARQDLDTEFCNEERGICNGGTEEKGVRVFRGELLHLIRAVASSGARMETNLPLIVDPLSDTAESQDDKSSPSNTSPSCLNSVHSAPSPKYGIATDIRHPLDQSFLLAIGHHPPILAALQHPDLVDLLLELLEAALTVRREVEMGVFSEGVEQGRVGKRG